MSVYDVKWYDYYSYWIFLWFILYILGIFPYQPSYIYVIAVVFVTTQFLRSLITFNYDLNDINYKIAVFKIIYILRPTIDFGRENLIANIVIFIIYLIFIYYTNKKLEDIYFNKNSHLYMVKGMTFKKFIKLRGYPNFLTKFDDK